MLDNATPQAFACVPQSMTTRETAKRAREITMSTLLAHVCPLPAARTPCFLYTHNHFFIFRLQCNNDLLRQRSL